MSCIAHMAHEQSRMLGGEKPLSGDPHLVAALAQETRRSPFLSFFPSPSFPFAACRSRQKVVETLLVALPVFFFFFLDFYQSAILTM